MSSPGQQGEKRLLRNIILLLFVSDYSMIMPVLQGTLCLSKTTLLLQNISSNNYMKKSCFKKKTCERIPCGTFWFPQLEMTNIISKKNVFEAVLLQWCSRLYLYIHVLCSCWCLFSYMNGNIEMASLTLVSLTL